MQASIKCQKDFEELTKEKEERSTVLTKLKEKLENDYRALASDIAGLKVAIFQDPT